MSAVRRGARAEGPVVADAVACASPLPLGAGLPGPTGPGKGQGEGVPMRGAERPSAASPPVPTLALEREHWQAGRFRVAGGDGVGLGCLSGPVVAAVVILPPGCAVIDGVRDSKVLSAAQRER